MKKILIVIPGLGYGGTNRALLNLLGLLDQKKYHVDLFALSHQGVLKKELEKWGLLPEEKLLPAFFSFPKGEEMRTLRSKAENLAIRFYIRCFLHGDRQKVFTAAAKRLKPQCYDAVVAFQEGLATEFTACLDAPYRVAWFHCDYSKHLQEKGGIDENPVYSRFDRIVAVSEYTARVFRDCLPAVAHKVVAIHNPMNQEAIREKSQQKLEDPQFVPGACTLLSVGRMDPLKRFPVIPAIAAQLREKQIPFRWYILGGEEGEEMDRVRAAIAENDIADQVILLGSRENPYPYIRSAYAVVCPSLSEACPNVVSEAMILGVPIVAADFPSAAELIENGKNGLICPLEDMSRTLTELWENRPLYNRICSVLQDFQYDNQGILRDAERVLDGAMQ